MNKIGLIFKREFSTRIKNKSFLLMSILGPLLMTAVLVIPMLVEKMQENEIKHVAIIDETHILGDIIGDFESYKFTSLPDTTLDAVRKDFANSGYNAVLFIPKNIYRSNNAILYSNVWVNDALKAYVSYTLRRYLESLALRKENVSAETIKRVSTPVFVGVQKWDEDGEYIDEETSLAQKAGIAIGAAAILYFFIFMYGVLVLRGVLEEKSSRVVEVIVSSVKPIQLMFGKILGIGTAGVIQFIIWVSLTVMLVYGAQVYLFPETYDPTPLPEMGQYIGEANTSTQMVSQDAKNLDYAVDLFRNLEGINWTVLLTSFVLFFILGYILYASIFAAIGGIIGQDTDSQQFVLPVSLPLILSIFMLQGIIANPNGDLAFWLSMCPFTSPIIMLARIPFGVPYWELTLSIAILIVSCYIMGWIAAKMYRAGILHYGRKMSFKMVLSIFKK